MKNAVTVVLVNFKNADKTIACIRALERQSVKPDCVYIVDNASTEQEQSRFKSAFGESLDQGGVSLDQSCLTLRWLWNSQNVGFAAACNQGMKDALGNGFDGYFWLLNNDTEPEEHALENLLKAAENSKAAITGSLIYKADGELSGGVGKVHPWFGSVRRVKDVNQQDFDYVEGSSMLIAPQCIERIGFMDEKFFLYFEETDYCLRARKAGLTMAWATDSVVYHDIGSTTGSEKKHGGVPFFLDCLMIRNRIRFCKRNGFSRLGTACGLIISLLLRVKRGQLKRVVTILRLVLSSSYAKKFIVENGGSL